MRASKSYLLSKEVVEKINDLSLGTGLSRSKIVELCVNYVYDNELIAEAMASNFKNRKKSVIRVEETREEKKEEKNDGFTLKL